MIIPKCGAHAFGALLSKGGHDVAIYVGRRAHLAVTEQLHHDSRVYAGREQQRRCGVSPVVEPDVADAGAGEQPGPGPVIGVLVERSAVGLGEDQVDVLPVDAYIKPLPSTR